MLYQNAFYEQVECRVEAKCVIGTRDWYQVHDWYQVLPFAGVDPATLEVGVEVGVKSQI
jgi:hypothetical protein